MIPNELREKFTADGAFVFQFEKLSLEMPKVRPIDCAVEPTSC